MFPLATSHIAHLCNQLNHVALPISMLRFKSIISYYNSSKIKLFLQKKMQNFRASGSPARPTCLRRLGALPPGPQPPTTVGGFQQTPIGFRRLGAPPPDPQNSPPLRISGYAPGRRIVTHAEHLSMQNCYRYFVSDHDMKKCVKTFFQRPAVLIFRTHSTF